jgi:hypothetical protein
MKIFKKRYYYNRAADRSNQNSRLTPNGSLQIPIDFVVNNTQSVGSYPTDMIENNNAQQQQRHNLASSSSNQFMQTQTKNTIQYIDGNGNLTNGVPAFISADGSQIILKDADGMSGEFTSHSTSAFPPEQSSQHHHVQNNGHHFKQTSSATSSMVSPPSQSAGRGTSTLERRDDSNKQQTSPSNSDMAVTIAQGEVLRTYPKAVKATQSFWYKPKISRDEAIGLLKDKAPGTFLIRDSNNFQGAFGLALKVDKPPPNVQIKSDMDPQNELVRHFLIEPVTKGVRIKGCCNEPTFGSLAALVYQHSLMQLALPCLLILPNHDLSFDQHPQQQQEDSNSSEVKRTASLKSQNQQQSGHSAQAKDGGYLLERGAGMSLN